MINGFTEIAITKLDVLSGIEQLKAAIKYQYDGKTSVRFPSELQTLEKVEAIYDTMQGWDEDITQVRDYDALPEATKQYLDFVSDFVGVPIRLISTGPDRKQTIVRAA